MVAKAVSSQAADPDLISTIPYGWFLQSLSIPIISYRDKS